MNYWITTHWPPREGSDPNEIGDGVWLPDGREEAGKDFSPGDRILIYQSRNGRTEIRTLSDGSTEKILCIKGKEGFVAVGEALSKIYKNGDAKPSKYIDDTEILWCWQADIKLLSKSGFLSREDANNILGYKKRYNYRGFGDFHSGLKKISKEEFDKLLTKFLNGDKIITKTFPPNRSNISEGESLAHFLLKHYVASNPTDVFNDDGIEIIKIEYPFPTGDRADILFKDSLGKVIGTEIEIDVNDEEYEGILQAIKYRYMAEPLTNRKCGDSRAVLIAYSISKKMKEICKNYNVECIEINKIVVNDWAEYGTGLNIKNSYKSKI
jgi:hypothetical protein